MPALPDPRPIETLNPTRRALVHDQLNDRIFEWKPEWASTWPDRRAHAPGVVEWDGLLLDGWEPVQGMTVPPLTDQVLQDVLQEALDEAIRDRVDASLARIVYSYRKLLPKDRTGAIVQRVLGALASLPGEHWLPDYEDSDLGARG